MNLVSVAGTVAFAPAGAYAAAKHAQLAFSRSTPRCSPGRHPVHTILPGFVETEASRSGRSCAAGSCAAS